MGQIFNFYLCLYYFARKQYKIDPINFVMNDKPQDV